MELTNKIKHISDFLKKYRYVVLVILIGCVFLLLPGKDKNEDVSVQPEPTTQSSAQNLEERLASVLRLIDGAGEVRVIMSVALGEEVIYQTNESQNSSDNTTNIKIDTVTVTSSDRSTHGLVKQINPETFKGAVVVCDGAEDPIVRLSIVDAISKLTGLGANQISVLKMK